MRYYTAFIAAVVCLVSVSCDNSQFLKAVDDIFFEAKFKHFDNRQKSAEDVIYVRKGSVIKTVWDNPQNTRYETDLSGADAYMAKITRQNSENSGVIYIEIEIIESSVEERSLDITLHLTLPKGEIKKPPVPLKLPLFFGDGGDSGDEETPNIKHVGSDEGFANAMQEAINESSGSGETVTIVLLKDIEMTETIVLKSDNINIESVKSVKIEGNTIKRGAGFKDEFFVVLGGSSLTLKNVTLDGGAKWTNAGDPPQGITFASPPSPAFGATNDIEHGGIVATAPLVLVSGDDATLTLCDNAVIRNNNNSSAGLYGGGGVRVEAGGRLLMDGENAQIAYNSARNSTIGYGGSVFVTSDSQFELTRGSLNNNYAQQGGSVYNLGTFAMSGGTISSNSANRGGGVYNGPGSTFNMLSGDITGNKAAEFGGGVINSGTFTMVGGAISGNVAKNDGNGVYHSGNAFTMEVSAVVKNDNDVYLPNGKCITVNSDLDGSGSVARITPASYTLATQVLNGSAVTANHMRFEVTSNANGPYYCVDADGKLSFQANQVIWLGEGSVHDSPYNSSAGTFVIPSGLKAKVFMVGGGGGGTGRNGGEILSGGKGGAVQELTLSIAGSYDWIIGDKGEGRMWYDVEQGGGSTDFGPISVDGGAGGKEVAALADSANGVRPSFADKIPDGWRLGGFSLKDSYYGADGGSIRGGDDTLEIKIPGITGGGAARNGYENTAGAGTFFGAGGGSAQGNCYPNSGFRGVILIYLQSAQ